MKQIGILEFLVVITQSWRGVIIQSICYETKLKLMGVCS
jgi:hypothetical protein